MGRSKARYPLQLDTPFVETCRHFAVDTYTMECMLVACLVLSPLGLQAGVAMDENVERMLQKMTIKSSHLPTFTIAVQGELAVE